MQTKPGNGHNVELEKFLDDIKAVVQDGEHLLKVGVNTVKERAAAGARTTDRVVREHPYRTMGIVLGVGVVIGLLAAGMFTREED